MKQIPIVGVFLTALLALFGQTQLLTEVPASMMRTILQSLSIPFTAAGDDAFELKLGAATATLTAGKGDLRLSLPLPNRTQLETVNRWNVQHRFFRAYSDASGTPHLEADLDTAKGVTRQAVEAFISNFRSAASIFAVEMAHSSVTGNPAASKTRVALPFGNFALWINAKDWQQTAQEGPMMFRQLNGDGYAMVIAEPGGAANSLDKLKDVLLGNARKGITDLKVTLESKRAVNGQDVLVLGMEGTVNGIELRYLVNAYSNPLATIQVLTYTSKEAFEKNIPAFTELLNGLEIMTEAVPDADNSPGPGRLQLPSGKAFINFEKSKWKIISSAPMSPYVLAHESNAAFAQVLWESLNMPVDTIADLGLANIMRIDPDADVTFKGKRVVNGVEMIQINVDATVRAAPLSYRNYYYSGKAGTIQIMTWATQADIKDHEKDLTDLLDGFHLIP